MQYAGRENPFNRIRDLEARIAEVEKELITARSEVAYAKEGARRLAEVEKERAPRHVDDMNDLVMMGMARDEAIRERDAARADLETLGQMHDRTDALQTENDRLRKGILDFITGDYPNPRQHRPGKCPHDVYYWQECEQCNAEHFAKLLGERDG